MTDDEIGECINAGLIDTVMGAFAPVGESRWCLVGTCKMDRQLLPADAEEARDLAFAKWQGLADEIRAAADDLVRTLRLHKPGNVRISGQMSFFSIGGVSYSRSPSLGGAPFEYVLEPGDREEVERLWGSVRSGPVRGSRSLQSALRRFGYAFERPLVDDKVIDLMIAAESWFLATGRDELTYRLALNAANFMTGARTKRATFEFMQHAYQVRSCIVHGSAPASRDLVLEDGTRVDLDRHAGALQDFMRDALKGAVERVAGGSWTNDWLSLTLGDSDRVTTR